MSDSTDTPTTSLVAIDFHGDQIVTCMKDGEPQVAMRRIVENVGLAWQPQHRKLSEDGERFQCHHMVTVDAAGRQYPMLMMPVAKLPLWLAAVNPNKVSDPVKRAKLELYQAESAIVLHDYWTKGVAVRGDTEGLVTALDPGAMRAVGGMMKSIVAKALTEALPAMIAAAVRDQVASHRYQVVEGVSALEVLEMGGFPRGRRPRGMAQFATRRLLDYHIAQQGRVARSKHGSGRVYLYDEVLSRRWLDQGGRRTLEGWRNERLGVGQVALQLVSR